MKCNNPRCGAEAPAGRRYCDRECCRLAAQYRRDARRVRRRQRLTRCQRIPCGAPLPKGASRYCSPECRNACQQRKAPDPHACRGCGAAVEVNRAWCSPACREARPLAPPKPAKAPAPVKAPCPDCGKRTALDAGVAYCLDREGCGWMATPRERRAAA